MNSAMRYCLGAAFSVGAVLSATQAYGQAAPAPSPPVTLESFAAPPFLDRPELSPNGQYYAAKLSIGGRQILGILSLFDKTVKPTVVSVDQSNISVDGWRWVNDDWLLLSVSANQGVEGEKWRFYRVMSMNRVTGKLIPIGFKEGGQNGGDIVWIASDGTPRIKLAMQSSVYLGEDFWPNVREIDVSTGKERVDTARRTDINDYVADASGAVRIGIGYDALRRSQKLLYRRKGSGPFDLADRANLAKGEDLITPALLLAEMDKAVTIDSPDGFSALYALDLATMTRGEKLFGVDKYDIDGIVPGVTGDTVAGIYVTENRGRIAWIDPAMKEVQASIDAAVGPGMAQIVSWDRSMQTLLVNVGGPDQAGIYYHYDRARGTMQKVAYADDTFRMRKFAPVTTIAYKASDGLDISAVLTLPKDRPAKSLPLILFPHGGPHARDSERWDWIAQYFAWRGYAVIQPNYRGSTGFGNALYEAGFGEWGLKMQDDLNDAVAHLAKQGVIDSKRVCIAGASYGGYAAMRGSQRDGDKFRCAISYAGVSDLAALAKFDRNSLFGKENVSSLKNKAPDFPAVSPLRFPEQFSAPILIMHGKIDLRVPVEQSRDMANKLKAAGKTYRYVEQPLGDHHFSRKEDRLQFLQEVDAFLNQYNPPDPAAPIVAKP